MLKFWRRQTGVSAPRLAIRPELPWHWRALAILLLSAVGLALAGWIYDAGRRFAGFDRSESSERLTELETRVKVLSDELAVAQAAADSSAARLQLESTAQQRLAASIKTLEEDNAKLKADLAVFESLAGNDNVIPKWGISRLEVRKAGADGRYSYRMLVTKSGNLQDRNFRGQLELLANVRHGSKVDSMRIEDKDIGRGETLQFRFFRRVEGVFVVPEGAVLDSIEARLIEGGQVKANARLTEGEIGG